MSDQKMKFYELFDKYCSENEKKTLKIITQDLYDKVLNAIQLIVRLSLLRKTTLIPEY